MFPIIMEIIISDIEINIESAIPPGHLNIPGFQNPQIIASITKNGKDKNSFIENGVVSSIVGNIPKNNIIKYMTAIQNPYFVPLLSNLCIALLYHFLFGRGI